MASLASRQNRCASWGREGGYTPSGHALLVVVDEELAQEVDGSRVRQVLVLRRHEAAERLLGAVSEELLHVWVQHQAILVQVGVEVIGAQHLGDLHELVLVVMAVEERLLSEDLFLVRVWSAKRHHPQRVAHTIPANMQPRLHMSRE